MQLRIAAAVFLVFVCTALFYVWQREVTRPLVLPGGTTEEKVLFWKGVIEARGGEKAYDAFADAVLYEPSLQQHDDAHLFGRALYEREGMQAFGVCDAQFRYGCFHEFIARAITEHGGDAIKEAERACEHTSDGDVLACEHGIGHGILAARGYGEKDAVAALSVCATLRNVDPIGGCYGGVFMEYNQRTMLGDEPRAFSGAPFDICTAAGDAFREACHFWVPEWWERVAFVDVAKPEAFRHMGQWCAGLSEARQRRVCFEGIGNVAPATAAFDSETIATLCAQMGSTDRVLACVSTAAQYVDTSAKESLCSDFSGDARAYCMGTRTPDLQALFTEM